MFCFPLTYLAKTKKEALDRGDKFYHPGKQCRQWHLSEFYTKAQRCKICARERVCAARYKNPAYAASQRKACHRNYHERYKHDDAIAQKGRDRNKEYRKKEGYNKQFTEYMRQWRRRKFDEGDESVISREAWRNILGRSIRAGYSKTHSTQEILGYAPNELRKHISSLFLDGMTWANHGDWHIDHVRPISSFPPNTHPSIVHALSNLQPLWAADNLEKSDKYDA